MLLGSELQESLEHAKEHVYRTYCSHLKAATLYAGKGKAQSNPLGEDIEHRLRHTGGLVLWRGKIDSSDNQRLNYFLGMVQREFCMHPLNSPTEHKVTIAVPQCEWLDSDFAGIKTYRHFMGFNKKSPNNVLYLRCSQNHAIVVPTSEKSLDRLLHDNVGKIWEDLSRLGICCPLS